MSGKRPTQARRKRDRELTAKSSWIARAQRARAGALLGFMGLVCLLALAVPSARSVVLTGSGFSANVSATVTPNRLPQHGSTPVTLAVKGTVAPTSGDSSSAPTALEVDLDRQLTVRSAGVPVCTLKRLHAENLHANDLGGLENYSPANMRALCGDALVGRGTVHSTVQFPDQQPFPMRVAAYLFNAHIPGSSARILIYQETKGGPGGRYVALAHSGPHELQTQLNGGGGGYATVTAFEFRFGKTWRHKGQQISYLSGRCSAGTWSNRVALTLSNGQQQSGAISQHCARSN